jgi:NADP-dependent 3-hydroxy acid dehydrogenase YdfG
MQKIVFITGATAGFGQACAYKFAENQYNLILNGRRTDRLQQLQKKLLDQYNTQSFLLPFDVRDRESTFNEISNLPGEWRDVDVLINNAGLALGRDYFQDADLDDWETMIDTNFKGLLYVSKAVVPFMTQRNKGHIINVGSVAGKEVYEKGNVYCATKQAVDSISKAMRIDLLKHRIKVTAIHPGAAETEFSLVRFKGDEEISKKMYEGYKPLSAQDVADVIYYTATLPEHVCINDLVLTSIQQANGIYFYKE